MARQILLSDDPRQTFRTILGGQSVRVRAWWQPFDSAWYLTLQFTDGRGICSGVRLVEGGRPLDDDIGDFVGGIAVVGVGEPGRTAWTSTHRLVYLDASEV